MKKEYLSILLYIFISSYSFGQNDYTYQIPNDLNDGWRTYSLLSQNVDTTLIYKGFRQLAQINHKIHSALLIKNDAIVFEEYYQDHNAHTPHDLRSTTKSIRSLLMGIAIDKGHIASIDDPISKYLNHQVPQKNISELKGQITIRHLLTMSSGLDCDDWDKKSKGQEDKVYKKKDWVQYTLDLPMIHTPGEVRSYCSMGTLLIAVIIEQVSGQTIQEFADEYLFKPLGIHTIKWDHTTKNRPIISASKRLYMTPRDMAKIGKLVLQKGMWNDQSIISEQWINASTSIQTQLAGIDYGFLWWKFPFTLANTPIKATLATGNGGQYIIIFPEYDMIAVFTGGAYNSQEDKLPFKIVNDLFLPSLDH